MIHLDNLKIHFKIDRQNILLFPDNLIFLCLRSKKALELLPLICVSLSSGLQTPSLFLNNSKPFENEEFEASCSAPGEKGLFIFRFYLKFRTGEPQTIKQLQTTGNSTKTLIKLRHIGDCYLSCDYEISLLSGNKRSNSSNETHVTVKGDPIV